MRFTIKTKLALTFTILTLLSCVMAGLAIMNLSSLNSQISDIVNGPSAQVQNSDDIEINALYMIRAEKNMIMDSDAAPDQRGTSRDERLPSEGYRSRRACEEGRHRGPPQTKLEEFMTAWRELMAV